MQTTKCKVKNEKHCIACFAVLHCILVPLYSQQAFAHGFGQRYDLPVPLWLYLLGAGAAVLLSFVVIGIFVRGTPGLSGYPRFNLLSTPVGRILSHPVLLFGCKLLSVGFFVLVILTGLLGWQNPTRNLAPPLVWVIWWVGLAYVSALLGNFWALINPWKILFTWAETLYRRFDAEGELSLDLPYPGWLGFCPGFVLFFAFAWVELVHGGGEWPATLALITIYYSAITWLGMFLFGKYRWLKFGEAFSIVFGLLARLAPTEVRVKNEEVCARCSFDCRDWEGECINCYECFERAEDDEREWNLRPFAVGLLRNEAISPSLTAFVILMLSTVTFDGFTATPLWANVESTLYDLLAFLDTDRLKLIGTAGLALFPALFLGIYLFFCHLMAVSSNAGLRVGEMARLFVFSLIPIALAYHLAHYFSYLLIQGQLIIPILSDPFGWDWNLFGTRDYRVNIGIVDASFVWFMAVASIVLGHIIAVYLSHVIALKNLKEPKTALRSQYPMLALMVGYTVISLWIIAQPIVESSVGG
jgi:hypothetical protein